MARIDVIMPQMGESIAEGTLSKWLKQVGDQVKRDEPMFEISTDKVDAEIPAPNAGVLAEILVQQGQTVAVNTVVARLETDASAAATAPVAAPAPPIAPPAPAAPAPSRPSAAAPAPAPAPARTAPAPAAESPGRRAAEPAAPAHAVPATEAWPGDRVEPWSRIRKLTADHMIMSRRVSAHVQTLFEVDYTRVSQVRARRKKDYAERGVNLTYLAFIAKAIAENLGKHPSLNAAVAQDATIFRRDINLGIAVALDWGLIVPVIKHADELSLMGIARAINDLGERARTKKLSPDDVQRGTFTITNPGVFGSYAGLPIINQPQVAILGVGTIEKRASVVTLPDGTDGIAPRLKGMLTMSFDHRVVDGADADRFLAAVKQMLEAFPEDAG